MTNKEIGELRRRMKPDRTNLTAVYGCYVASSGPVRHAGPESARSVL